MNPDKFFSKKLIPIFIMVSLLEAANFHKLTASSFTQDGFQRIPDLIFEQSVSWLPLWHDTQRPISLKEGLIEMIIIIDCQYEGYTSLESCDLISYILLKSKKFPDKSVLMRVCDKGTNGIVDSIDRINLDGKMLDNILKEVWSWVESADIGGQELNMGAGLNIQAFVTVGKQLPNGFVDTRQLIQAINPPPDGKLHSLLKRLDLRLDGE